jgi:hypothetical protein
MADFDAQLPVRTVATEFTTEVANASGTTINPAEDYAQGSTTSGENGVLVQGATTTSAPTYVTGTTNPLSLDTSGNLRVAATLTPSGTQNVNVIQWDGVTLGSPSNYGTSPGAVEVIGVNAFITNTPSVSGTVTANQGTANTLANAWPVEVTDGTNILGTSSHPVRIDPTGTTTQPISGTVTANAGTGTFAENLTQVGGSSIALGQTTMSASIPVTIASNQTPLNVQIGGVTPVVTYATTTAVASGSTATQTVNGPINLDAVHVTASGEVKVVIAIGVTGSEATKWVGFTSAANKNFDWVLQDTYAIASGSDVKITITNKDTAAMDIYSSVVNH